ncbi:hypothetical protein D3C73_1407030 [compost metagenome]
MRRATRPHRPVIQRIAAFLDQLDEVLDVIDLQAAGHDQHVRAGAHQGDRRQILQRVVAQRFLVQRGRGHQRAVDRVKQRIAVRLGLRHHARADVATGAGLVVDNDGLAQRLRQWL